MEKVNIINNRDEQVDALAPVIISASRSTDIPAFYAKWFFNRLAKGYCVWYNPFNRKPYYVSFKRCKVIVFWTKNPKPIMPYLHELDRRGIHYYFQVTLNDYEQEGFEPNVPALQDRIETFKELSRKIGKEKVIWRFDPLIVTKNLTLDDLVQKIRNVGECLKGYTDKLVFSFVDVRPYKKVQSNLIKETNCFTRENVLSAEMNHAQRMELLDGLMKIRNAWQAEGWNLEMATCAEDVDYSQYGINHNRCIDGELIERLFSEDKGLIYYLHTGKIVEPDMFGEYPPLPLKPKNLKDKGQRAACGCIESKDIGAYNTCSHFCVYCYANSGRECVAQNVAHHTDDSESVIE